MGKALLEIKKLKKLFDFITAVLSNLLLINNSFQYVLVFKKTFIFINMPLFLYDLGKLLASEPQFGLVVFHRAGCTRWHCGMRHALHRLNPRLCGARLNPRLSFVEWLQPGCIRGSSFFTELGKV
jgi:hypothetical protein